MTEYGAHSQPSLASADPILETHYTHSVVDDLSEALQSVTQDFGSAPVPRKRTILPYQVKSTPLYSQDICCQSSNHEIGAQEVTNEDKIDISSKVGRKLNISCIFLKFVCKTNVLPMLIYIYLCFS
ncbi:putative hepatoma up-regulated protein [Schistosoma japonicum]|uniref:Putative hepatoma up-regulated protein n=1 Tax=Schistosoma japonicum TaxID=6182 RepID=A0A4Z2D948_SCHJA|nr:putative hepatoma up-regulated protein [Schistosoma japonicum]